MNRAREAARPRRQHLGGFALDDQLRGEFARSGLFEFWWAKPANPIALRAVEGDAVAWLSPSGAVVGLLLQGDYAGAVGTRTEAFEFEPGREATRFDLEVVNDGARVEVYLVTGSS